MATPLGLQRLAPVLISLWMCACVISSKKRLLKSCTKPEARHRPSLVAQHGALPFCVWPVGTAVLWRQLLTLAKLLLVFPFPSPPRPFFCLLRGGRYSKHGGSAESLLPACSPRRQHTAARITSSPLSSASGLWISSHSPKFGRLTSKRAEPLDFFRSALGYRRPLFPFV